MPIGTTACGSNSKQSESNILIAYFSRVGNMNFDKNIDAVTSASVNMDAYDAVIMIYPNWWGTLPMPVFTFLEEYDFSGKIILPLCTHEGSRIGRSESDIASICPEAQLLAELSVRGSDAGSVQTEVEEWISSSGILRKFPASLNIKCKYHNFLRNHVSILFLLPSHLFQKRKEKQDCDI